MTSRETCISNPHYTLTPYTLLTPPPSSPSKSSSTEEEWPSTVRHISPAWPPTSNILHATLSHPHPSQPSKLVSGGSYGEASASSVPHIFLIRFLSQIPSAVFRADPCCGSDRRSAPRAARQGSVITRGRSSPLPSSQGDGRYAAGQGR